MRKKSVETIKHNIKFSKKINSKLYSFHPGFIEDPITKNQNKKTMILFGKKES